MGTWCSQTFPGIRDGIGRAARMLAATPELARYSFDIDELLQSAVLHWIEIVGEAARGVSDKVRAAHPEVPWRVITDMRNRDSGRLTLAGSRNGTERRSSVPAPG
jgi:hypothetical protein